ncbi:MAG: DUF4294 domain-containing protein [Bacteroidales bacterium]|nr:DUF4294 domain-containing protein [Bacteroidales bacterium]
MLIRNWVILFFIFLSSVVSAQEKLPVFARAKIIDGDTLLVVNLKEVLVISFLNLDKRAERKMTRLIRNVKIAYPYARLAGIKLSEYEEILAQAPNQKARRQIMRQVEEELEAEYGQDLRKLTITQGKILLKLVDRETGNSSYQLATDLRGEFRAVFYQAIARLFTYNLKVKYDPEGEDRDIETIVKMIENGQL